jgi:hypothetical protein
MSGAFWFYRFSHTIFALPCGVNVRGGSRDPARGRIRAIVLAMVFARTAAMCSTVLRIGNRQTKPRTAKAQTGLQTLGGGSMLRFGRSFHRNDGVPESHLLCAFTGGPRHCLLLFPDEALPHGHSSFSALH